MVGWYEPKGTVLAAEISTLPLQGNAVHVVVGMKLAVIPEGKPEMLYVIGENVPRKGALALKLNCAVPLPA